MVRRIVGVPKVRHVFWQGSQLTCRFLVEIGPFFLESEDLPIRPANDWEQQAFDTLAELKRSIDSGPVDQDRIESLNIEILRREQRLGKALSVQHLMAKPVPLAGGEDGPDRRAYALFDGAVWRSDLTGGLGRDELETQFVPAGAEGPNSRSGIPVAVRRAVWQRDYGRCAKCGRREQIGRAHV